MTSYSTESELSTPPLTPPHIDNSPEELDSSDWESQIAKLVGFKEESPKFNIDLPEVDIASLELPESPPQEVSQEQPLSSNPFAKLALVASGTLTIVLVAGVFLTQIMSNDNQKPKNNFVTSAVSVSPKTELSDQSLEQEIETLKTKLALAEQAQAVTAAQQNLRNRVTPNLTIPQVNNRTALPMQTAATPRVVTVERIITRPQYPPNTLPTTFPPVAVAPTVAIPTFSLDLKPEMQAFPLPRPELLEQWINLDELGSYGQVSTTDQSDVNTNNIVSANQTNIAQPPSNSQAQPTPPQPDILVSQAQPQNVKSVKVGTSAKAVLLTAVFGETTTGRNNQRNNDNDKNESLEVFVVQLKEPLKSVDGAIALPANTELLTQIRSISERGLLQLDVVKFMVQENGQLQERSLPKNAISVRAAQGRPLVANKFPNNSSSITGIDAGLFVLGGITKAAELLNRIDTEVTTNAGSTIVTNSGGNRNLAAGIVEGGLKSVVPLITQRNQQSISQMMQQPHKVWLIPSGQEVEIYVNRTMQF
jgi:hypothetical protein